MIRRPSGAISVRIRSSSNVCVSETLTFIELMTCAEGTPVTVIVEVVRSLAGVLPACAEDARVTRATQSPRDARRPRGGAPPRGGFPPAGAGPPGPFRVAQEGGARRDRDPGGVNVQKVVGVVPAVEVPRPDREDV